MDIYSSNIDLVLFMAMKEKQNKLVEWFVYQEIQISFPTSSEYEDFVRRYNAMVKSDNDTRNNSDESVSCRFNG